MYIPKKHEIPICEKQLLTLDEAAAYFNIGKYKINQLTDTRNCKFVEYLGQERLINRQLFEEYLNKKHSI